MVKKVLTRCYRFGEYCWRYVEEFLFPTVIKPNKLADVNTTIATARNTLNIGHRFRGDVGEVM